MGKIINLAGTSLPQFQISLGGTGFRRLRFKNGFDGDLQWEPTNDRTITLPDESGTIALVSTRKVGFTYGYTGTDGSGAGYLDDFDGKWVYLTLNAIRTIGNASSGAHIAASWTETLFEHFWSRYTNTQSPLLDSAGAGASRGASASTDYNANRRITIPDFRGRVIAGAGSGSGLTARTKGAIVGAETHALSVAELAAHTHTIDHVSAFNGGGAQFGGSTRADTPQTTTSSTGSGTAHNNMQPTAFEHLIISAGAR